MALATVALMDLRGLLSCFAVAALAISIWGHISQRLIDRSVNRHIWMGVVLGLGVVASMLLPLRAEAGILMDLRGPLLGAAAFIGGPISAIIATSLGLASRFYLGGVGIWAGACNILLTTVVGLVGHSIARGRPTKALGLAALSACVALAKPVCSFALLHSRFSSNSDKIISLALLSFGCTWLVLLSMQREERLRALLAQDSVYRAIIRALPDSLNAKDRDSRFIAVNPATARLMNAASPADMIGKSDADFYPPDMSALFRREELLVLGNSVVGPIDQEVRFADGTYRWLMSMKTPLLDDHGAVVGIITHNRDVTDRKTLEAELLQTQSVLQEAMNNMADGLVLYDQDGVIRFCNQQYANMFPKTADLRVEGSRFADIIRASVTRGEEGPKPDLEAYVAERVRLLPRSGERLLELLDGRSIELRSRLLPGSDTLIVFTDVTAKKQLERDLQRRASQDPLTSLANRSAFEFEFEAAHRQAVSGNSAYAVLMLDLDRFKPVNDTYGHAVGDQLLVEVAARLREAVRDGIIAARLGGDEFAFLVVGQDIETSTVKLANRLVKTLKKPFTIGSITLTPSGSLGIAYFPRNSTDPFELLRLADKALYAVKTRGGGAWLATSVTTGDPRGAAKTEPGIQSAA